MSTHIQLPSVHGSVTVRLNCSLTWCLNDPLCDIKILFWKKAARLGWIRDTAGQERFNSITSAYYRGAKGIVLVYDITKQETFDDLPKWMKMIDKYASEDAELLLVGNKLDCESDRIISRQQAERFASRISGMRFCEASAKDNFNVDEIFLKLVDDILSKMPLEVPSRELSNSVLSLQPEPDIPPELPPPRMRCCWDSCAFVKSQHLL